MARTVSLAMKDWPASDLIMWDGLIRKAGPLDAQGAFSHLRLTTQFSFRVGYERWLAWILNREPTSIFKMPSQRATPERLVEWLNSLGHLAVRTRFTLLDRTVRVLKASEPNADWSIHLHILKSVWRQTTSNQSNRKAGRILSSTVLLQAGRELARSIADGASTPLAAARLRRDGTMVAFLSLLPIRRRAFSELKLGQSVLVFQNYIVIALSSDMTKNGHPWETKVPATLEPILRHYIDVVRPWLLSQGRQLHDTLWVGQHGEALSSAAIGKNVAQATLRATGIRVPPHFFRDAAASTLARQSPGDALLIRPLLAHSGFGTAERHYIQAQGIETGRDFASVIAQLAKGDA